MQMSDDVVLCYTDVASNGEFNYTLLADLDELSRWLVQKLEKVY